MSLPSLDGLSIAQLQELVSLVVTQISTLESSAKDDIRIAKEAVINARATLESLQGPVDATPGTNSIRAVLAYGDDFIVANASQAVPLIVHGMETLTTVMIDITKALTA